MFLRAPALFMSNTQPPANIDLLSAVLAKTALGQHEVTTRTLGLPPLARRLLILVDGKRSGQELAMFVAGHSVADLLGDLLQRQCIEVVGAAAAAPAARSDTPQATAAPSGAEADLAALPPPESRNALELAMARNFMTNTVNTIFQPNTRLTLLKAIQACQTSAEARAVYPRWAEAMASSTIGAKRLAEFQDKLFKVL